MDYPIRSARRDDGPFLADMLVEAANWTAGSSRSRVDVLAEEATRRYIAGWPRAGDLGSVAETIDGERIGACWTRLFSSAMPGRGFIASGVPELTLGVRPVYRAQGVGRALLRAAMAQARAAGYARVSLNVASDNFARRLYISEGFAVVTDRGEAETMVALLR
ncbi:MULTISPECIES: GNAT family N-acetyltransferase [unclassified Rathayibacter]|uniref:GNAT family N-acetyltransferase n=1 Tax=unclassified Rathayibacter TaxID=2609250 RepID=UPI0007013603|nr:MULTISPECIES: GNAT family N-acetyltransferase [unclassified Rathayibacter]KQQ04146.1 histone acetyltransferase [Rathayibacter sp. Leaf294]KQS12600.1 histone acetyltransferase [Rathayibacter sp. Leaf185]